MNNYTKLYWLTRLDGINALFCTLLVVSILAILAIIIGNLMGMDMDSCYRESEVIERKKFRQKIQGYLKWLYIVAFLSCLVVVFLPTQKEAIIIVAGGKTMNYIQSDTSLQKIPHQTTKIISDYMDKQIKEINKP